ncbi:MAG: Hsp20/alpha crystallin family protein [Candidatus Rokubacteria bacterium]|nr:Hsp20/alpha crystallin family protein [Candidatus Rokubacteria bacterium]
MRPWREMEDMQREMEDMFTPFFRGLAWPWREERAWSPAIDMVERKDEIVVRVDLPGLEEKDIEVSVDDGRLTIRGERKETREEKDEGYEYYCERRAGAFFRGLPLPTGVDADKVKASFKNGVLEVHLPKAKESKPKKVEIKAA